MRSIDLSKTKRKFLTVEEFALVTERSIHFVNFLIYSQKIRSEFRVRQIPQPLIPLSELERHMDEKI